MKKNKRTSLHAKIVFFSFYFFPQILQFETTKTFQGKRETEHKSSKHKFLYIYYDVHWYCNSYLYYTRTLAFLYWLLAMILVLSNMSFPGPGDTQSSFWEKNKTPIQDTDTSCQIIQQSMQKENSTSKWNISVI